MQDFVRLFHALDATTKTNEKLTALRRYFANAEAADAAWATYFLCGGKLKRMISGKLLRQWAAEQADVPLWLLEESYHAVGDLAETISLLVIGGADEAPQSLSEWVEHRLLPLAGMEESLAREGLRDIWWHTRIDARFVLMKLITGAFRVGVSKRLVTRALAAEFRIAPEVMAHRLMGQWQPTAEFFKSLKRAEQDGPLPSKPYPFCLAHAWPASDPLESLGNCEEFAAEWKWDGIRCQLIRRDGQVFIWSRGEELMEGRWPEIEQAAAELPDGTVLDGELLAARSDGRILPFAELQRRIGRKRVGKKLMQDVPVILLAFDLLEQAGTDIRALPWTARRQQLELLLSKLPDSAIRINGLIEAKSWQEWVAIRESSRSMHAEGLMLKRRDACYEVGRPRGTWWKWKVDPYTVDAVLIYAQKGHGRRANLFTDYTFAVWNDNQLVPFAKAYSGLSDVEIQQVDRFVRSHTNETFGPVRSVTPKLVMELAFEGIQRSSRHKSGIATRFPRIVRWRQDKQPEDANSLEDLQALLPPEAPA